MDIIQHLHTWILQMEATSLKIPLEQQEYLQQLMDILNDVRQGTIPTQLHQQIQHLVHTIQEKGIRSLPRQNSYRNGIRDMKWSSFQY